MICDISNAYPSNISVDAEHNVQFHFVFYGDGCEEADFILYDATDTTSAPKKLTTYLYDSRRTYFNGEEIDANSNGSSLGGKFINGRSYIWKVRMYESVDLTKGITPSVRRTSGEISAPSFFFGTVQDRDESMTEKQIPIEKGLEFSLPMWMRIGDDATYRIVNSYDPDTGLCTLKNEFSTVPSKGDKYSLSSVKTYVPTGELASNQLFIEKNITELTGTDFEASGSSFSGFCWYMEIRNSYVAITDYDPKTGIIKLDTPEFSVEEPGTKYNIWSAFIDSRYFAINTRPTPYFTSAIGYADGENILFEAELSGSYLVNYYWLDIYEDDILVETTKQIHMAKLSYYFKKARVGKQYHAVFHVVTQDGMTNQEDAAWWSNGNSETNKTNKCSLLSVKDDLIGCVIPSFDIKKQAVLLSVYGVPKVSGVLKSGNNSDLSSFEIGTGLGYSFSSGDCVILNDSKTYPIKQYDEYTGLVTISIPATSYYPKGTSFKICSGFEFSKDDSVRILRRHGDNVVLVGDFTTSSIYDYTCALNTECQYIILPNKKIEQNVNGHKWISHYYNEVVFGYNVPTGRAWSIYGLSPLPYNKITNDDTRILYPYQDKYTRYEISDIWIETIDVDTNNAVTHNINKVTYIGNQSKPVAVSGGNNYNSFPLSFTIGEVNCPGNKIKFGTITEIQKWERFVASGLLIIIKDPDGSVWAGAITSDSYEKTRYSGRAEYKVTFEFTELEDVDSILISD